jgi:hypothetical protein
MRRHPRLALLSLVCLAVGIALLVPFEQALPVALGIAALLGFVVLGTAAIVSPAYLAADQEPDEDAG